MKEQIETVRKYLGAMKLEKTEDGYYVRYRKSEKNKAMLDDIFQYEDIMEENGWKRINDFEITITEKEFNRMHKLYMNTLYNRSI